MKRLIITTFIIATAFTTSDAQQVSFEYSSYDNNRNANRSDLRAIQNFENQLDQFSYSMMVENVWQARKSKTAIIRSMENEIRKTRSELNAISENSYSHSTSVRQRANRNRNSSIYSKRNGSQSYEFDRLIKQLEDLKRIKRRFVNTDLVQSRRRGIINKRDHRKLMYSFRDIMRDDLEQARQGRRRG